MPSLKSLLPDPEHLFELEPEEIAGFLLEYLQSISGGLNRFNLIRPDALSEFPHELRSRIAEVLMESWIWLEREGLLAPKLGTVSGGDWYFITRRGMQIKSQCDLTSYNNANILPRKLLHPQIATKVWSDFLRGNYEEAILLAFKEVEIRVRDAGGFSNTDVGVELMRKAFHENTGPLTDQTAVTAEKQALSHLFAGVVGYYKNPSSHRRVKIEPDEAVEMLILASHLFKIVEDRAAKAT